MAKAKSKKQDLSVAAALRAAAEAGAIRRQQATEKRWAEEERRQNATEKREAQRISLLKKKLEKEAEHTFARLFKEALGHAVNWTENSFRLIVAGSDRLGSGRETPNSQSLSEASEQRLEELRVITIMVEERFREGGCEVTHLLHRWRCRNDESYHVCGTSERGSGTCHGSTDERSDMSPEFGKEYLQHVKAQGYIAIRVTVPKTKAVT